MTLGEKNNVKIDNVFPWICEYAFLDTPDYAADKVLIAREVPVKFRRREYRSQFCPYVMVFCRFNAKHEEAFLKCMADLERKLLMSGRRDYLEWCERLFAALVERSWGIQAESDQLKMR